MQFADSLSALPKWLELVAYLILGVVWIAPLKPLFLWMNTGRWRLLTGATMKAPAIQPESCQTMAEVRAGVDALDQELVALIARRFAFMDAAARIKPSRDAVRDEAPQGAGHRQCRRSGARRRHPRRPDSGDLGTARRSVDRL